MAVTLWTSFAVTGCVTREPLPTEFCTTAQPIYISETDELSEQTARQILRHNRIGRSLCGW